MKYTVVAFVPVLHAGYIKFFKKYPGVLFLLGSELIEQFPHLEKEIRSLHSDDMKKAIMSLDLFDDVRIADGNVLKTLSQSYDNIVMPNEDVSRGTAKFYLDGVDVLYDNIFLRWDKSITLKESEVSPDRIISNSEFDKEMLAQAQTEAQKSSDWWRQVGVVVVKDGVVIVGGHNAHLPSEHSPYVLGDPRNNFGPGERYDLTTAIHGEAHIIAKAAKTGISLQGTSLYVTTFPCPTCAKLIACSGITKVFYKDGYSLLDAEQILKLHDITVVLVR